jgi:hypothetical protein
LTGAGVTRRFISESKDRKSHLPLGIWLFCFSKFCLLQFAPGQTFTPSIAKKSFINQILKNNLLKFFEIVCGNTNFVVYYNYHNYVVMVKPTSGVGVIFLPRDFKKQMLCWQDFKHNL